MALDTILVGLQANDEPDSVVPSVLDIAAPAGASVVVAFAHTEDAYEAAREDFDGQASPDELAELNQTVREVVNRLEEADVSYSVRGVVDESGDRFVTLADDADADLLIIQGQKRSPTGKALFGSTAQTILLNAPCPVTFVRR